MNEYGRFQEDGSFRVTNPRTPEPWLHYLLRPDRPGTETFASGVTASAGGFDVRGTHENTLVDCRLHLNDRDDVGRYVYVRDAESGSLFTTSWQPVQAENQRCETVFRFGSARFESECGGIAAEDELFLPTDFDGWVREIILTNRSGRPRILDIVPFVPVLLGDALVRLLAGDNDAFFGGARWDRELRGIVFRRHHGLPLDSDPEKISGLLGNVALFHCTLNEAETPYETDMETFLGDRFRSLANPRAVEEGRLSSRDTPHLRRACGAFHRRVTLQPGETLRFAVLLALGSTEDYYLGGKGELKEIVSRAADGGERSRMLKATLNRWAEKLSKPALAVSDLRVSRAWPWLLYQCETVTVLNRMKSRYHTGYEYGWGFRDLLQDALYLLPTDTEALRKIILRAAAQIFRDGKCYHNFFLRQEGNRSVEASDDPLWFLDAVAAWCRETGDPSLLAERAPWAGEKAEDPKESGATVLRHCEACIEGLLADRSPRGLLWLKDCDWNDDLNESRIGGEPRRSLESVMASQQLVSSLRNWAETLERAAPALRDAARSPFSPAFIRAEADRVAKTLILHAREEGGTFLRVLDPVTGDHLGSSRSPEGALFLESQVFAVTAGLVEGEEAARLLARTAETLDTECGAMLCRPYFTGLADRNELPKRTWNIEKEPPGMKENGGIFMHLNAWLIEAWCRAGRGSEAASLYGKTLPESLSADQDRYRAEPFVYPEYVRGAGRDFFGRGGHTWLTGTAPTVFRSLTERVIGIRATWEGLAVDPCPDPSWKVFSLVREFRGAVYRVRFCNPEGVQCGVRAVKMNGTAIEAGTGRGVVLPLLGRGEEADFEVVMG